MACFRLLHDDDDDEVFHKYKQPTGCECQLAANDL